MIHNSIQSTLFSFSFFAYNLLQQIEENNSTETTPPTTSRNCWIESLAAGY
jgi:hypothetical protein